MELRKTLDEPIPHQLNLRGMLYTLVYVSSAVVEFTAEDLRAMLKKIRPRNEACSITGMLLYRDGCFVQAMEGEKEAVLALQQKIYLDPRHHNIITLYQSEIPQRMFASWSMGFKNLGDLDPAENAGYTDFLSQPITPAAMAANPSHARKLLEIFRAASR
jgi:hypothetical protein